MNTKELFELFDEIKPPYPKNFRLFLVSNDGYLYINKGHKSASSHSGAFGSFNFNRLDRGKILDMFTKIDFLLGELIRLKIIGFEFEVNEKLSDIISKFQLQVRVSILKEWNVIDYDLSKELKPLVDVRNSLAHKFDEGEVRYNNQFLTEKNALRKLSDDFANIWIKLVGIYSKEQETIDIEKLKTDLIKWQSN